MVELICSAPVTWQQTSPTVGPTMGRTAPVSSTATGPQQDRRNSKMCRRVESPSALNVVKGFRDAVVAPPGADVARSFRVLADDTRLAIVQLLVLTNLTAGEIVERVGAPQNAVSYHLRQLRELRLVRDRQSSLDGRDVYYSLDLERLKALYHAAGSALHPALLRDRGESLSSLPTDSKLRFLFLCTHNSARSQLTEALARLIGGHAIEASSAGRDPRELHPFTVRLLEDWQVDVSQHSAKTVDRFRVQSFDFVITVCDRMREDCPTFPGCATVAHWSLPDPTSIEDPDEQWGVFRSIAGELRTRIAYLLALVCPLPPAISHFY